MNSSIVPDYIQSAFDLLGIPIPSDGAILYVVIVLIVAPAFFCIGALARRRSATAARRHIAWLLVAVFAIALVAHAYSFYNIQTFRDGDGNKVVITFPISGCDAEKVYDKDGNQTSVDLKLYKLGGLRVYDPIGDKIGHLNTVCPNSYFFHQLGYLIAIAMLFALGGYCAGFVSRALWALWSSRSRKESGSNSEAAA